MHFTTSAATMHSKIKKCVTICLTRICSDRFSRHWTCLCDCRSSCADSEQQQQYRPVAIQTTSLLHLFDVVSLSICKINMLMIKIPPGQRNVTVIIDEQEEDQFSLKMFQVFNKNCFENSCQCHFQVLTRQLRQIFA